MMARLSLYTIAAHLWCSSASLPSWASPLQTVLDGLAEACWDAAGGGE